MKYYQLQIKELELHPDILSIKEKKIKFDQIKQIILMVENNINESLIIKNIKKIKNL